MKYFLGLIFLLTFYLQAQAYTVTIGTHYSPPWSLGNCKGAEIDLIKAAFKEVNIEVECQYLSYARLVKTFFMGEVKFATPITYQDGMNQDVYYSNKFHSYVDVVVSLEDKKITLDDLKNKVVVAYQNASIYLGEDFKKAVKQASSYQELPGRKNQIDMLIKGRVDYVIGEVNILKYLFEKINRDKKLYVNLVVKDWDIRAASHDKYLIEKFNEGLSKVQKQKEKIFKKYNIR